MLLQNEMINEIVQKFWLILKFTGASVSAEFNNESMSIFFVKKFMKKSVLKVGQRFTVFCCEMAVKLTF